MNFPTSASGPCSSMRGRFSTRATTIRPFFLPLKTLRGVEQRSVNFKNLLRQKELLLEEMQHRIANSLQIIASILLLKASTVQSEETRLHLKDAHQRVMSVAAVQQHLHASSRGELMPVASYLTKLCATLANSMISDSRPVTIEVAGEGGSLSSSDAVSIGLIVTEGVLNALKHAFPEGKTDCRVLVTYEASGSDWKLSIADNGVGKPAHDLDGEKRGLGTSIVNALAEQLDAQVSVTSTTAGTTLSVTHTASVKLLPQAALDACLPRNRISRIINEREADALELPRAKRRERSLRIGPTL